MLNIIISYLIIVNIFTFMMYYVDKKKAIKHKRRISEKTLLLLSLAGGAIGALLSMQIFHHKTKKWYFKATGLGSIILWILIFFLIIYN